MPFPMCQTFILPPSVCLWVQDVSSADSFIQGRYVRVVELRPTWHSSLSSSCCSLLTWEHQFSSVSTLSPGNNERTSAESNTYYRKRVPVRMNLICTQFFFFFFFPSVKDVSSPFGCLIDVLRALQKQMAFVRWQSYRCRGQRWRARWHACPPDSAILRSQRKYIVKAAKMYVKESINWERKP